MAKSANLYARIEPDLKEQAEGILSALGIPAYLEEPWHSRGLRVMSVDNYLVFYIPDAAAQTVTIIRVMYGGRDIASQLDTLEQP